MTNAKTSLSHFLEIDLEKLLREQRRVHHQAVRDRFLAGLARSLQDHPGIESVWISLLSSSSRDWVRSELDPSGHALSLKGKTTAENRQMRSFYKSLASTRNAISSSARESVDALHIAIPGWIASAEYTRDEVIHTAHYLLENPGVDLTNKVILKIREDVWDQALPEASRSVAPGPRL